MVVLLALAVCVYRGVRNGVIIALWVLGLVLSIALFRYHVTSALDLSF